MSVPKYTHNDYLVGWISPLSVEQTAAYRMLDEVHDRLRQPPEDHNSYYLGSIQGHNVVIAGLPTTGNCSAATVVAHMIRTFPCLRFGLLVGIGGGVPTRTEEGLIRLGDVVVSKPTGKHSGAVQYDHGKAEAGEFQRTGCLAAPPNVLLGAAQRLSVICDKDPLQAHLNRIDTSLKKLRRYKHPGKDFDRLYPAGYMHLDKNLSCQKSGCDASKIIIRVKEDDEEEDDDNGNDEQCATVHRGVIASGELVVRDGLQRDKLAKKYNVLCFEMEAAGVLNDFPCLIIRGIADYADSHKNDKWQGYAAATAAAYARELFYHLPIEEVSQCKVAEKDIFQIKQDTHYVALNSLEASIKEWLDPHNQSTDHRSARELHHAGTGSWLLQNKQYVRWKMNAIQALWLHGIPGCGKTILSSTVIEDMKVFALNSATTTSSLLYFYFDQTISSKCTFDMMLRSMAFQLYHQCETSRQHIERLYISCNNGKEKPQVWVLMDVLRSATKALGRTWVILDALDECKTKKELFNWLAMPETRQWHLFFTSREEHDIKQAMAEWIIADNIIAIDAEAVDEDIRAFLRSKIDHDKDFMRWKKRPDERAMIESRLMARANGMFRLVSCQIDSLRNCLDLLNLELTLESLPKTLYDMYDQILIQILPENRPSAVRLLQFLSRSERPLRVDEAVDAIAVRLSSTPAFCAQYRMPNSSDISRLCKSLTRVTNRTVTTWGAEDTTEMQLQLAHLSVQEYLLSGKVQETFRDYFQEPLANSCIANISLAYLHQAWQEHWTYRQENARLRQDNRRVRERHWALWGKTQSLGPLGRQYYGTELEGWVSQQSRLPFLRFAAQYWLAHAALAEKAGRVWLDRTKYLFATNAFTEYWLLIYDPDPYSTFNFREYDLDSDSRSNTESFCHKTRVNALYYASLGGLAISAAALLEEGANVNGRTGYFGNALQAASFQGHIEVVKLLLERGADVNARGGYYGNALKAASAQGHHEIVKLLLDNDADFNAKGGGYWGSSILQTASEHGHTEIVKLLLDQKDIRVNAREGHYGNGLQAASKRGHTEIVKLWLDRSLAVRRKTLPTVTAHRNANIFESLLGKKADVNAEGYDNCNALQAASLRGHVEIVKLLLERDDIEVDAEGGHSGRALQCASKRGHTEIVKLLLDKGANVNIGEGGYCKALLDAILGNHGEIVKLLVDHGADINSIDCDKDKVNEVIGLGVDGIMKLLFSSQVDSYLAEIGTWAIPVIRAATIMEPMLSETLSLESLSLESSKLSTTSSSQSTQEEISDLWSLEPILDPSVKSMGDRAEDPVWTTDPQDPCSDSLESRSSFNSLSETASVAPLRAV